MTKVFLSAFSVKERCTSDPFGPSRTEQCFKDDCDVNHIMRRFAAGQVPKFAKTGLQFGDFTQVVDHQQALQLVIDAESEFMKLPADLRKRFGNDVSDFLAFYDDPASYDECVKLGLKVAKPVVSAEGSAVGDGAA